MVTGVCLLGLRYNRNNKGTLKAGLLKLRRDNADGIDASRNR
ncbi:hypothetical protein PF006_g26587, partial [Phytophthora fragariae]